MTPSQTSNRKVQHLLSLSLVSTYQVAAHCPSVITWLPWRSVHSGGESEYSYNTECRHTNTNTATCIPGFVYWIYPSLLAERHWCAWEPVFQLYSISCPWELPGVLLYQYPSSEYWQSQMELFPPWWPEDNEGTKHPAPTREERSGCPRAWALNNIIRLGILQWTNSFSKHLSAKCHEGRILELEGSLHGSPQEWMRFLDWYRCQDLISCPQACSVFTLLH